MNHTHNFDLSENPRTNESTRQRWHNTPATLKSYNKKDMNHKKSLIFSLARLMSSTVIASCVFFFANSSRVAKAPLLRWTHTAAKLNPSQTLNLFPGYWQSLKPKQRIVGRVLLISPLAKLFPVKACTCSPLETVIIKRFCAKNTAGGHTHRSANNNYYWMECVADATRKLYIYGLRGVCLSVRWRF